MGSLRDKITLGSKLAAPSGRFCGLDLQPEAGSYAGALAGLWCRKLGRASIGGHRVFSDTQFVQRAKSRIDTICSVTPPKDLSPAERHSATGPAGTAQRSAKNMASLLNLCGRKAEFSSWVAETRAQLAVGAMLKCDESGDKFPNIVDHWFRRITELLEQQGLSLSPAHER